MVFSCCQVGSYFVPVAPPLDFSPLARLQRAPAATPLGSYRNGEGWRPTSDLPLAEADHTPSHKDDCLWRR